MTNREIAVYLELSGENPFKVRAFRQAARTIESNPDNIEKMADAGRLREIRGIGKKVENVILEILHSSKSSLFLNLKASFPNSIAELLQLSGLVPKRVKTLWEKLDISTTGELEYACRENRLLMLEGFGERSQANILRAIEFKNRYRNLLSESLSMAEEIFGLIGETHLFSRMTIAGSLRRGKSILKDIDVLHTTKGNWDRKRGIQWLTLLADEGGVIAAGQTKVSIRRRGIQVDFRIVEEGSYPNALQHFTGSKEHKTMLRARAIKMNLKMNEYGLFRGEISIPVQNEESLYSSLGLSYIPPEIREGGDEIERSVERNLPKLVERKEIRGMIHIHSRYSDGLNSIEELVDACRERSLTS